MRRLIATVAATGLLFLPAGTALGADASTLAAGDVGSYLLQLGPIGALVWGAYLLGRGVKVGLVVELAPTDREAIAKLTAALLDRNAGRGAPA